MKISSFQFLIAICFQRIFDSASFSPITSKSSFTIIPNGPWTVSTSGYNRKKNTRLFFFEEQQYADSQIPEEFRKEIEDAEAKTPAAKDRAERIFWFVAVGGIFLTCALSSAIYGYVVNFEDPDAQGLSKVQESLWYQASKTLPILSTKVGLYIDMSIAGICYLLFENEMTRKFNTQEEIWKEIKRRKESRTGGERRSKKKSKISKKKGSRMKAFAEVLETEDQVNEQVGEVGSQLLDSAEGSSKEGEEPRDEGGVFGGLKEMYKKADEMAAAQALILNKNLEEAGVVEKITDESGLNVIGRDAAKKIQEKSERKE